MLRQITEAAAVYKISVMAAIRICCASPMCSLIESEMLEKRARREGLLSFREWDEKQRKEWANDETSNVSLSDWKRQKRKQKPDQDLYAEAVNQRKKS